MKIKTETDNKTTSFNDYLVINYLFMFSKVT